MVARTGIQFVTSNSGKFREVRAILRPFGIAVRWSRRSLPEMQADTLEEVVRGKLAAAARSSVPLLVEDSGLFIDALNGFPGVYSSYAYRTLGVSTVLRLAQTQRSRRAAFRTVAGLRMGKDVRLFRGESIGHLSRRPRGKGGFGFDPIFQPAGQSRTFAEMDLATKNLFSHRARAMTALARELEAVRGGPRAPRAGKQS
ncbi:MAG: non-canonical purine NTP pyrophosphatase [Thermoplasmata archaeon]|nr:non-canonical purine NTP pyrophosphatase [Thermoplasmata archaeon]